MAFLSLEGMVRGYHVYISIWTAAISKELISFKREVTNTFDPFGFLDHSIDNRVGETIPLLYYYL